MKKIYNAPYFKVVEVKNDIIATSVTVDSNNFNDTDRIQGRHGMWDDDFSEEDVY